MPVLNQQDAPLAASKGTSDSSHWYSFTDGQWLPLYTPEKNYTLREARKDQAAGKVVTVTGDAAGLRGLTLDGVNVQSGSVGIYAVGKNELRINDVSVRRFETGIEQRGGARNHWRETYVASSTTTPTAVMTSPQADTMFQ